MCEPSCLVSIYYLAYLTLSHPYYHFKIRCKIFGPFHLNWHESLSVLCSLFFLCLSFFFISFMSLGRWIQWTCEQYIWRMWNISWFWILLVALNSWIIKKLPQAIWYHRSYFTFLHSSIQEPACPKFLSFFRNLLKCAWKVYGRYALICEMLDYCLM